MCKRITLIVLLIISMMTAGVVRADSVSEATSHSFQQVKSPVALQSANPRSLLNPDLRSAPRHAGSKGIGLALAILPPLPDLPLFFSVRDAEAEASHSLSIRSLTPRRTRAPPPRA